MDSFNASILFETPPGKIYLVNDRIFLICQKSDIFFNLSICIFYISILQNLIKISI